MARRLYMLMLKDRPRLAGPTPLVKPLGPRSAAPSSGTIETCGGRRRGVSEAGHGTGAVG